MHAATRRFPPAPLAVTFLLSAVCAAAQPSTYAVAFVSTAATGSAMNAQGMAAGVRLRLPPGCTPSTCLGVREAVVWSGGTATVLPLIAGYSTVTPVSINATGWVAGYAGEPTSTGARAVVWKPAGAGYTAIDLGVLPDTSSSWAAGIDDQGRAIGWSTTGGAIPTATAPFVWTEQTGLVDLSAQGFPNEVPLAVSPGGTVATPSYWYRVDDPGSVAPLGPRPAGFSGPGNFPAAINDAGDQVRFLISTSTSHRPYLFRYHGAAATWQQIWSQPAGSSGIFGVGGINSQGDVTATINNAGLMAPGPDGLAQPLSPRLSLAYTSGADPATILVPTGGPINDAGQILARAVIGRSARLVRLSAAEACASGCIRVASIQMTGRMFSDPPGYCTPEAYNEIKALLRLTSEDGAPVRRAAVRARFLDEYYLDEPVMGTAGFNGAVQLMHTGPACVGATSILVEEVTPRRRRRLDRINGELADWVIAQP
jgi:hypothetical protein